MSLVGTRPILQDELQKYELHHRARIAIKPGITGMWQVSGRSDIAVLQNCGICSSSFPMKRSCRVRMKSRKMTTKLRSK